MSKPKEKWMNTKTGECFDQVCSNGVLLIEKSAYDELEKECTRLNSEITKYIMHAEALAEALDKAICMLGTIEDIDQPLARFRKFTASKETKGVKND